MSEATADFEVYEGEEYFAGCFGVRSDAWAEVKRYASQVDSPEVYEVTRTKVPLGEDPPSPPAASAKPLTDEQINAITDQQWASGVNKPIYAAHMAYARAIERAHGIGGQQ